MMLTSGRAEGGTIQSNYNFYGVQVPISDQPLSYVALSTSAYTFLLPANPALNVSGRFKVNKLPDNTTVVVAGCTVHWLFCNVAALPSFSGPCHAPVSLARYSSFKLRT